MKRSVKALLDELRELIVDGTRIITEEKDRWDYSFDASFGRHLPDAVVQPLTTEETAEIMKLANRWQVPIYPRGQSTSLSGGPLPVKGGLVLDCSQWRSKLEIHPDDRIAIVSPGVITADIDKAAERFGLMYPPDPSSLDISTIGGNLAENAGGPRCIKYGVTKDYVLGLEVVTPEGEIIRTGGKTVKNVTGYDLTKLIVGSEGTLGIITEAILHLIPRPSATTSIFAVFDDIGLAADAIIDMMTSGILPSKLELMDKYCIRAVESYKPMGLPADARALLLVELDGNPDAIHTEADSVQRQLQKAGAHLVETAKTKEEAEKMWKARKLVSPAIMRKKTGKFSEDATVPVSKIPEMFNRLQRIREKYDVDLVVFGHAGDGNLHPNILADPEDQEEVKRVEAAIEEIFTEALKLEGTLTGEHGIGTMKSPFLELELGKTGVDMMKRIKQAWDPNNVLNPGKIFPEPGQPFRLKNK